MAAAGGATGVWRSVVGELADQLHWSFLPPLMVYFAAGVSGLTGVVGAFFVKEHLDLSAAFLAGLTFWAGLPWVLKLPLGHLVDLIWRRKAWLVVLGAALVAASLAIMLGLITRRDAMAGLMPVESWFVLAALLAPAGYVVQDVVADAMTVEAVPSEGADGRPLGEAESKSLHTTMQTLGRFAIVSGLLSVAAVNITLFAGVERLSDAERLEIYAQVYRLAFIIPLLSVSGVILAAVMQRSDGPGAGPGPKETAVADWQIFAGGAVFAALSLGLGLSGWAWAQEAVFAGTLAVILFLIRRLTAELAPGQARTLVGTAIIIFVFRAVPLPGPGWTWFEIDVLGFDERFLSVLSLITSCLALFGMIALRPVMARWSIARVVALLSIASGALSLPNLALYFGVHEWTAAMTDGVVDARFIAVLDTAVESPLGQVAMIPMLAWIARNAPPHLKATFFAVMASFTNLALSASSLATRHLNEVFVVARATGDAPADYSQLGTLLLATAVLGVAAPLAAIAAVQAGRLRSTD